MAEREQRLIPDWAEQERPGDLAWIRENLHIFWPVAQTQYAMIMIGRGAIVVDTTAQPTGAGHPFAYVDQESIEYWQDEDLQRMVGEYDPSWEFVSSLIKTDNRVSNYRVGVLVAKTLETTSQSRGEIDPQSKTPAEAALVFQADLEPPDLDTLREWEEEGGCEAACPHRCWTEPDGTCEHGHPSWLLKLGLI